jgi:hypothetical protein
MNGNTWKWAAGALLSLVMFLLGAMAGDTIASIRFSGLTTKLEAHSELPGHPVVLQMVNDMKRSQGRIEAKLERQSAILREIEQKVTAVANGG